MDLTPQLLTSVAFKEQWRGYNQDEVDEFLERVATAVGELQQRLRDASTRATEAEHRLLERTDEDEVRRTLVLAQRTATQAIDEARAEAERLVAEAEEAAAARLAEGERRAEELDARLDERERNELTTFSDRRTALEAEVRSLEAFIGERRERVRAELTTLLAGLEATTAAVDPPETSSSSSLETGEPTQHVDMAGVLDADDQADDVEATAPPETDGPPTGEVAAVGTNEPDAEAQLRWQDDDPEADPFLAELRRAVTDTEPLGPRDHDPSEAIHVSADGEDAGGRFRLRRNR